MICTDSHTGACFVVAEALRFWLDGFRAWRGYLTHLRYDEAEAATAGLMSGNLWKKGVRGVRGKVRIASVLRVCFAILTTKRTIALNQK